VKTLYTGTIRRTGTYRISGIRGRQPRARLRWTSPAVLPSPSGRTLVFIEPPVGLPMLDTKRRRRRARRSALGVQLEVLGIEAREHDQVYREHSFGPNAIMISFNPEIWFKPYVPLRQRDGAEGGPV
jgi:hypothetical protein